MDALKLTQIEERADDAALGVTTFAVDPGEAYPAALEDLAARVASALAPEKNTEKKPPPRFITVGGEIRENPLATIYFPQAQRLGVNALRWAGEVSVDPDADIEDLSQADRELRAAALELARLWFTEHLHQAQDYKPLRVHILKDERFRL